MDRRRALLASVAATMAVGVCTVGLAAVSGVGLFGFGGGSGSRRAASASTTSTSSTAAPQVVTQQRDVYDLYVVPTQPSGSGPTTDAPAPSVAPDAAAPVPQAQSQPSTTVPPRQQQGPATTTPPSAVPQSPTTTSPSAPPTTRPPGVPADWPADKPIPPMPPGCQKPQLEDNGVWNCDH